MTIDLVLIHPGAAHGIYGKLGDTLVAVEPPLWPRFIAGYIRDKGYSVKIIDAEAVKLSPDAVAIEIAMLRPRLVAIAVFGHQPSGSTQQMAGAGETARKIKQRWPESQIMMLGGHVSALPERTMREEQIDFACVGEGPVTIHEVLKGNVPGAPGLVWRTGNLICVNERAPEIDIDKLTDWAWDLLPMHLYKAHNWQCFGTIDKRQPYASIYTSLNCPYSCLTGDTTINTIYGNIPIAELAKRFGKVGIPVYTYDSETRQVFISDSIHIKKYGTNKQIVRVHFDDGSYIDCTPDHQFLQFRTGRNGVVEFPCEARDLKAGNRLRAITYESHLPGGRVIISWGRRKAKYRSRMIMEYVLGRKLKSTEHVHHVNRDKSNDHPDNLMYCKTAKDHFDLHPELSERMRTNNPIKKMTPEWRAKITKSQTGLKRSDTAIANYRKAARKRSDDPAYIEKLRIAAIKREAAFKGRVWWTPISGKSYRSIEPRHPTDRMGRIGFNPWKEINHRVVRVQKLKRRADVYCLTVPETGWFFANDVLVKNCSFCCISAPFGNKKYRMRKSADVIDEIRYLRDMYGVKTFKIIDEMFVLNERHYMAIAHGLAEINHNDDLNIWAYARVDTVKPHTLAALRRAGIKWLALGIESGSKYVMDGVDKRLKNNEIEQVVRAIQAADINVIGNYIFGLPDDDMDTMRQTLDLALHLNTEFANFYSAMAYPGSPLYAEAVKSGWTLPESWRGYSQHNSSCRPMDTKFVSGAVVLKFRDEAFTTYFRNPAYLEMVERKFGPETLEHVKQMTKYKLKRDLVDAYFAPPEKASSQ